MKVIRTVSAALAMIPSLVSYVLCFVAASVWNAATEGWEDGK